MLCLVLVSSPLFIYSFRKIGEGGIARFCFCVEFFLMLLVMPHCKWISFTSCFVHVAADKAVIRTFVTFEDALLGCPWDCSAIPFSFVLR